MSTSLGVPQSTPIPDPNVPSPSAPAISDPASTQVIPGTTVVGTGVTGDVWSYTIPPITSVIAPSAPATLPPSSDPAPTAAPSSAPEPSGTFVATQIILSGTTVVGGTETGVPWSYTIPDQSVVSSIFVPVTIPPTTTPSESFPLTNSLTSHTESPAPTTPSLPGYTEPVPRPLPDASHSVLSGGIVAAILVGLLFLMFAIAGCLCIRMRRRQRDAGGDRERGNPEKEVGVVWGRTQEKRVAGWKARRGMHNLENSGDGYSEGLGSEVVAPTGASTGRFRQGPTPGSESVERLIQQPGRDGGPSVYSPNTRPNTNPINLSITYPVNARYPQTRSPDTLPTVNTRASSSHPIQRNVNTSTNDDTNNKEPTSRSKSPNAKLKRPIPPPTPHVYAPPPEDTPEPSPAPYSINPFSTRPTSPYRAASPYGSHSSSQGRKVLSKHRAPVLPPSTSAFMRHMLPTRTMSLRRPKTAPSVPAPSTSTAASAPARPGLNSLPSFIRDRRFSPGPSRNGSKSTSQGGGESVIFSPSPRPAAQLPPHAPARVSSPVSRNIPLLQPRQANTRDKYLAPPHNPYAGRDRSSQLTSTTRSGGTGWSRDTRSTGRSGGSVMTGRSGDSRATGRSADSRVASRSGGLAQIPESDREHGAGRRTHERPRRRHEGA
ncbi:unnamed protein product [Rhizoctonia solani]|uniref:Transmembrane protein n=1 Tax=Rhizoctonia solani TaxID=456999 RepID=A0A8H3BX25_9AGAM|nr:unnamed protein product [Rhizoctonia solani]